jgi:hypothetical protein
MRARHLRKAVGQVCREPARPAPARRFAFSTEKTYWHGKVCLAMAS